MSEGHASMGCVHGPGIVPSADYMLEMSVVRGMRGVCMNLARGGLGGEVVEGMRGLGFTNPVGTRGVLDVCLCLCCGGVGGIGGARVWDWASVWEVGVVLCLGVLGVLLSILLAP